MVVGMSFADMLCVCVCDCGAEWATQNRTNTTNSASRKPLRTLKSDPPMFPAPNFYFVALLVVGSAITLPVSQQSTVLSCGDGISTSTTSSTRNVEYSHSILAIFIKSYLSIKLHTTGSVLDIGIPVYRYPQHSYQA